jgi:hypothetical protein
MLENRQKGWYGCYSKIGKISAEQFIEIMRKDEIFEKANKTIKIRDFFAPDKKINKLNYIEDDIKVFQNYRNEITTKLKLKYNKKIIKI